MIFPSNSKEAKIIRDKEVRALYRIGYTMNEISKKMGVSKTTVFFAINNRYAYTKKSKDRRSIKRSVSRK